MYLCAGKKMVENGFIMIRFRKKLYEYNWISKEIPEKYPLDVNLFSRGLLPCKSYLILFEEAEC